MELPTIRQKQFIEIQKWNIVVHGTQTILSDYLVDHILSINTNIRNKWRICALWLESDKSNPREKGTTNSRSFRRWNLNIGINASHHKGSHFIQQPPACLMYTRAPYFPTRGAFIIANCFSIASDAPTAANKGIYELPYAHFITRLQWVFQRCASLTGRLRDEEWM